jgi:hypothetical protein
MAETDAQGFVPHRSTRTVKPLLVVGLPTAGIEAPENAQEM